MVSGGDIRALRLVVCLLFLSPGVTAQEGIIMTVEGPISPDKLGQTLAHEHVLCDFIGAS